MPREAQSKRIAGVDFKVTPMGAMEAVRVQALLLRTLGPALGRGIGALGGTLDSARTLGDLSIDGEGLSKAIAELAERLPEEELLAIIQRLLLGVQAVLPDPQGRSLVADFGDPTTFVNSFELVFAGRTMAVYAVIAFVLKANYPDFFETVLGTGGLLGAIRTSKKGAPGEQEKSSGSASSASQGQN